MFHFIQPFRLDALSYMAQLGRYGIKIPDWFPFLLTLAAIVFVLRWAPNTTSAICGATAYLLIVFFICNKAAFCNYYYLVLGALAGAIVTADIDAEARLTPGNEPVRLVSGAAASPTSLR